MTRLLAGFLALAVLAGCAGNQNVDDSEKVDLGAFRLGHNIVVASKMKKVPISRDATEEEWVASLTNALSDRFSRYEGDQLYHFGISVEGYALAPPGVPLVATPKSAVVLNITVWNDAEARKINEKPHQLLVLESFGDGAIVGSGYTLTREEQMENLSFNAARELEKWLSRQHRENGWFAPAPQTDDDGDAAVDPDETATDLTDDTGSVPQEVSEPVPDIADEAALSEEAAALSDATPQAPLAVILTDG